MSAQDKKKPASPTNDAGLTLPSPKQVEISRGANAATTPDTDAAISFLYLMHPRGPWTLTAIDPDGKGIATRTFGPDNEAAARSLLRQYNGERNLYFSVNTPVRELNSKAKKEDIGQANFLHVDIDPRAGENMAEEQQRIRELTTNLPPGVPLPSTVVFSGGGYQLFWRLAEPIAVADDAEQRAKVESCNRALEIKLNGDHCHSIDHIMRLPGTINLPNERKRQNGRQQALACLVEHHPERTYRLDQFPSAPERGGSTPTATDSLATTSPASISDLGELDRWRISERVKTIISNGRHPDETKPNDDSRSSWLFDATCHLVRAAVPEEIVLGILLDQRFGISESVLDHKGKALTYARRQIERAREAVTEPELARMNERHAVLLQEGGKTRVLSWEQSELDQTRQVPVLQSFDDFRNRYMNVRVRIGVDPKTDLPIIKQAGRWWLEHPSRRQYLGLRFLPGQPEETGEYLNLWRGFSVRPEKGSWALMQSHIREVLASGDPDTASYITRWMAWAVQKPDAPAEVALVLKGERGTGKGGFAHALKDLFGRHGWYVASGIQLTGRFNHHLRACCLLFADEAMAPGDKAAESTLKALITEPELTIEGKGVDAMQARNHLHMVMSSNEDWVVPAGHDERRFAVFDVSSVRKQDFEYFEALKRERDDGGLAAMLYDLQALDLRGWHPRLDVPQTAALRDQKERSLSAEDQFVLGVLEEGGIPGAQHHARTRYSNDQGSESGLYTAMRRASPRLRDHSDQRLSKVLKRWGCTPWSDGMARGWTFPPLADMRAEWDRRNPPHTWNALVEWVGERDPL